MNTYYTERSKYYSRELAFRQKNRDYPVGIERHYAGWQGKTRKDNNVIDAELLGFNKLGRQTERVWIVARDIKG